MRFQGIVFRALHPAWANDPLSGAGAARRGGRFNPKGVPALYLSLEMTTAWAEYQQGFPHRPQPVTLCAYEIDGEPILDLSSRNTLRAKGIHQSILACPWELLAGQKQTPPSWALARQLISDGIVGIIVPSFAPNAHKEARNLVLWRWNTVHAACTVRVIDDEQRLR